MAKSRAHIDKAKRNEELLKEAPFSRADYPDWCITINFYAAVHWIRAFLALHGVGVNHEIPYDDFNRELGKIGRTTGVNVQGVIEEFDELKGFSKNARYKCLSFHMYHDQLADAEKSLEVVKAFVTNHGIIP